MSTDLFRLLRQIGEILDDIGRPWALVGGLAVSTYVEPRFTRDIDIVIAVSNDEEAEDFLRIWQARGFVISDVVEQDAVERLATVRTLRTTEGAEGVVDLLFASSGIEEEIAADAKRIDLIPELAIPIARPGHLFALKLLAVEDQRPQDEMDLQQLAGALVEEEFEAARVAIAQIETRGYHRQRDLNALFEHYRPASF